MCFLKVGKKSNSVGTYIFMSEGAVRGTKAHLWSHVTGRNLSQSHYSAFIQSQVSSDMEDMI